MRDTWIKLADNMSTHVDIAAVNCQESNDLCNRFKIDGVPNLKLFTLNEDTDKLQIFDYNDERGLNKLIKFAEDHASSFVYKIDKIVAKPIKKRHVTLDEFLKKVKIILTFI